MKLYHGGIPGLRVGALIEPPLPGEGRHLVAGCPVCEARRQGQPSEYDENHRFDRVYVTTRREIARFFAAGYPRGDIYAVEPLGELDPDPEHEESFAVPAARVKWVLACGVVVSRPGEMRRWLKYAAGEM